MQVGDVAGEPARHVEAWREVTGVAPGDPVVAWLYAGQAAEGGGADDRTARLRADGKRAHVIRHGGSGPAGGGPRRALERQRIARLRWPPESEARDLGLSEKNGPRLTQSLNDGSVTRRPAAAVGLRITPQRRHVECIEHVLQPDRYAVQGAAPGLAIALAGLLQRQFGVDVCPGADVVFPGTDPHQAITCEIFRRHGSSRQPT